MKSDQFIRKIRNYSLISFLLPLITINLCLLLYKILGEIDTFPLFKYDGKKIEYSIDRYLSIQNEDHTFTNCPQYVSQAYYITVDGQKNRDLSLIFPYITEDFITPDLIKSKIKSVIIVRLKGINQRCVKNYKFLYLILKNFKTLEKILINAKREETSGFSKISNPYLYGEVSISRTARYFPATLIFKPLIILSAIFLLLYWRNNLALFKELENKNILGSFSKKFFYLGALSCIFLILHTLFLGLDFDSKLFTKIRRIIIIFFIVFEILAQTLLTRNLFKFKEGLKNYINPLILKLKIAFVIAILFITCLVFIFLVWGDLSGSTKHILEWNYFSALLIYYIISRLLWKKTKT